MSGVIAGAAGPKSSLGFGPPAAPCMPGLHLKADTFHEKRQAPSGLQGLLSLEGRYSVSGMEQPFCAQDALTAARA